MKALILQHEDSTPAGSTTTWLQARKIPFEIFWPSKNSQMPSLESFDYLIICGGSMNVDQEDKFPWLKAEKELIKASIAAGKKIVGLCLGSQLIAEVLGAKVGPHPQFEVGWHSVDLIEGHSIKVFQWHGYSFQLPKGAELRATNSNCKFQSFTYGQNVIAYQFHPESTQEWVLQCSQSPRLPKEGFVQTAEEIRQDMKFQPALQAWYFSELDRLAQKHELSAAK